MTTRKNPEKTGKPPLVQEKTLPEAQEKTLPEALQRRFPDPPDLNMFIEPRQTFLSERIETKLSKGENVVITAPPGYGMESLVKRISFNVTEKHQEYQVCFMDLLSIASRESFLSLLKNEVLKFARQGEFDKFLNSEKANLLALPEYLAKEKKIKLLICINNIQNMARFPDSFELQGEMKFMKRKQKNCVYLLYGHNRQLMISIFRGRHYPLANFGRLYTLDTPKLDGLEKCIRAYFFNSGKRITPEAIRLIKSITFYHTFAAQLLISQSWWRTSFLCTEQIARESLKCLVDQFSVQYQILLDQLSIKQINYLGALLVQAKGFCSKEKLKEYELGRSSNVSRIRESLVKRELIYSFHGETFIIDPLLEYWLANCYFGNPR